MIHSPRPGPDGASSNASALRSVFVTRVHQLLQLGYERLTTGHLAKEQEPAITGFLVEAIDGVLSDCPKQWMSFFSVHDDPPVNDGRRKGKTRRRVDLRIDSGRMKPRARFRFEAKRLSKRHPVTVYLGAKGLGCFISGDYARDDDEAGMLGYVQTGDPESWGKKLSEALTNAPSSYAVNSTVVFSSHSLPSVQLLKMYRSQHDRVTVKRPILIMHTLLKFH